MSTPTGEPMTGADYESRERLIAWDVPRVAADPEAMKAAVKEYIVLQMFERGIAGGLLESRRLISMAELEALLDYDAAPINKRKT